jgi:hypothetical protein
MLQISRSIETSVRHLLIAAIGLACALPASAQVNDSGATAPAEPGVAARLHWQTIYDDNVYRSADRPQSDVYSTLSGNLAVTGRVRRAALTANGSADWMHFRSLISERGANGRGDVELSFLFNRVTPYLSVSYSNSRHRQNLEVDTRPRIERSMLGAGIAIRLGGKTELDVSARRTMQEYDRRSTVDGVSLSESLNQVTDLVSVSVRRELTPLTRLTFAADSHLDQFERSPRRNADAVRLTAGLSSNGRVNGRAVVGLHVLRPRELSEYRSLYLSVGTGVTIRDQLQVRVDADRNVAPSSRAYAAYYEYYSYGGELTYAVGPSLRVSARVNRRETDYTLGNISAFSPTDPVRSNHEISYGSDISYRLGALMMVNVSGAYTERTSTEVARRFKGMSFRAGVSHVF